MSFAAKQASREARNLRSYVPKEKNHFDPHVSLHRTATSTSGTLVTVHMALGLYANLPDFVEIRSEEKRGRGIWCKRAIQRGSIILTQPPHVAVLGTQNLSLHCSYCMIPSSDGITLKRCTKCKTIWYCSSTCQIKDWKFHKHECPAIENWLSSAVDGSPPGEAIRSLGRILWGRKIEGGTSTWWREIECLQSHRTSIPASAIESHTQLAHALVRYIRVSSPSELESFGIHSSSDLVDLISQFSTNTFTLTSPTLSPLGTCVSPIAALFNHSCLPNAVIVFPHQPDPATTPASGPTRPLLHVIAIKDVAVGEEILTAYVDTSLPTSLRQQSLRETYNFSCTCLLCTDAASEVDPREALWCPKSCGGMCPFPESEGKRRSILRCRNCGAEFTVAEMDDIEDKLRIGREALEKATSLQFSDPARALKLTSHILPLLSRSPPSAHPILALLRLHQTLLIPSIATATDGDVLNDAIRSSARAVSGFMSVFEEGHPVRGISLAELGKLLAVDEPSAPDSTPSSSPAVRPDPFPPSGAARLALAVDTLKRALKELMIGFGEKLGGGDVGRDVRDTILNLEREMSVYERGVRNALENAGGTT